METFSFTGLDNARPVEITSTLQESVQSTGEDSFPDDEGVKYTISRAVEANRVLYVEIIPDSDIGYEKFVFELNADGAVNKCYAFEDGEYGLLFN